MTVDIDRTALKRSSKYLANALRVTLVYRSFPESKRSDIVTATELWLPEFSTGLLHARVRHIFREKTQ
jgi:hypothetical protein